MGNSGWSESAAARCQGRIFSYEDASEACRRDTGLLWSPSVVVGQEHGTDGMNGPWECRPVLTGGPMWTLQWCQKFNSYWIRATQRGQSKVLLPMGLNTSWRSHVLGTWQCNPRDYFQVPIFISFYWMIAFRYQDSYLGVGSLAYQYHHGVSSLALNTGLKQKLLKTYLGYLCLKAKLLSKSSRVMPKESVNLKWLPH